MEHVFKADFLYEYGNKSKMLPIVLCWFLAVSYKVGNMNNDWVNKSTDSCEAVWKLLKRKVSNKRHFLD